MAYSEEIKTVYGNKIRIRVCGILENNGKYLFANHQKLNNENIFWNFPGGGVEDNETLTDALKREFKEETQLDISVGRFCFINQVLVRPLHAIELYFIVNAASFDAKMGFDPELDILSELKWMGESEFLELPSNHKPMVFSNIKSINDVISRFQS